MELEKLINDDIKNAMLARDPERLEALRALLQKLVKQRRESADIYAAANREDLAKKERFEASIIEKYLPQQMGEAELTEKIKQIIAQVQAVSIKDMGKVMGAASKELAGKADNKKVSEIVKHLLGT